MTVEELQQQYASLCHAMQSGVAFKMNIEPGETMPKHLRVGVNSAMVQSSALIRLLFQKGVVTEQEYWEMAVLVMQEEVDSYQRFLSDDTGANVSLG